jgi:hypothetical protein
MLSLLRIRSSYTLVKLFLRLRELMMNEICSLFKLFKLYGLDELKRAAASELALYEWLLFCPFMTCETPRSLVEERLLLLLVDLILESSILEDG